VNYCRGSVFETHCSRRFYKFIAKIKRDVFADGVLLCTQTTISDFCAREDKRYRNHICTVDWRGECWSVLDDEITHHRSRVGRHKYGTSRLIFALSAPSLQGPWPILHRYFADTRQKYLDVIFSWWEFNLCNVINHVGGKRLGYWCRISSPVLQKLDKNGATVISDAMRNTRLVQRCVIKGTIHSVN